MSEFMDKVLARLDALEKGLSVLDEKAQFGYPAPARKRDEQLEGFVRRGSIQTYAFPLGCLTADRPEVARKTMAWSTSYTTGGEDVGAVTGMVPGFSTVEVSPLAGYTFQYVSGTNKLKAFTTAGTEVAAATNLQAAIGDTPMNVIGAQSGVFPLYTARDGDTILSVQIESETTLSASATNYWTLVTRRRLQGLEYGVDVGDTLDTSTVGLEARTPLVLYLSETGTRLSAGEQIVCYVSGSGSLRASLSGVTLIVTVKRQVT